MAKKIGKVRNERIESSKNNLRGFQLDNVPVQAVYHVLMPSAKNETPQISVGEISYSPIDIDNIQIIGCTTIKKPQNFAFSDGIHEYKYTATDSQLSMKFHNTEIVLEQWSIHYVDDAFAFFENLSKKRETQVFESHAWKLEVKPYSGFNAFMGQTKMSRKNQYREKRIGKLIHAYENTLSTNQLNTLRDYLSEILLNNWSTAEQKEQLVKIRQTLMEYLKKLDNRSLTTTIQKMVYRPSDELELRIPKAKLFHDKYPHFFVEGNIFDETGKCAKNREKRTFKLKFVPSGNELNAYINQASGKAIESLGTQATLGNWILRDVFQLSPYEPLTQAKLDELGINGIRLVKKQDIIEISFIWLDENNLPKDFWGDF